MIQLIPTRYKEKLPKGISYPVGAELISRMLVGVPQYQDLKLSFFFWSGGYQRILNADIIYFLEASFTRSDSSVSNTKKREETDWVKPKWAIGVSPVPSAMSRVVKDICIDEGLPTIKEWLLQEHPDSWYYGRKSIKLFYNVLEKALKIESAYRDREESHNSPLPHHAAYGSELRGSADQASSTPGERKPK